MFYLEHSFDKKTRKLYLIQWGRDGKRKIECPLKPYCFVRGKDELGYRHVLDNGSVKKVEFDDPAEVGKYKLNRETFESDVPFFRRAMLDLDMKINDVPICYVDIEVFSQAGMPTPDKDQIICVGMCWEDGCKEFLYLFDFLDEDENHIFNIEKKKRKLKSDVEILAHFSFEGAEKKMLDRFLELIKNTGCLVTWNGGESVYDERAFDIGYIAKRWVKFHVGQDLHSFDFITRHCRFFDLYMIYKDEHKRIGKSVKGGYGLNNIGLVELGMGKLKNSKQISELTRNELYKYCLDDGKGSGDVILTKRIAEKTNLINLKINLAQLANILLVAWDYRKLERKDELRPLILVDQLVLKGARKLKLVMNNRDFGETRRVKGAYVMLPKVGVHLGVQNFDVKQMYPNIIINEGISVDKKKELIPSIIEPLMEERRKLKKIYEQKRKAGEDYLNEYIMQYNYKVLANVFYGAFSANKLMEEGGAKIYRKTSRISDPDLGDAITGKGRQLLQTAIKKSNKLGFPSIYGDTDSCFIKIMKNKVDWLLVKLNDELYPYEMEAESSSYYKSILFLGKWVRENPNEDKKLVGLKKKYVYLEESGELGTRGTEIIKSNFCSWARTTVEELAKIILEGKTYEEIEKILAEKHRELVSGKYDTELPISINVKDLSEYSARKTKDGRDYKQQPHIRAYKKWLDMGGQKLFEITFYYTVQDVEPWNYGRSIPTEINYEWYWKKQILAPLKVMVRSAFHRELKVSRIRTKPLAKGQTTLGGFSS